MITILSVSFATSAIALSAQKVPCVKVEQPPVIDGTDSEKYWDAINPISIKDNVSGTMILLRSVHTEGKVYFSIWFPDSARNPLHKPWVWNKQKEVYESGPHREDTFVFKWSMMDENVDLSNFSDDNYTADVWYWKANRTNPAGYADDKMQILSDSPSEKATELTSLSGKKRYLSRISDKGKPAYKEIKEPSFDGNVLDRYPPTSPDGSRGDVRAKGQWQGGFWFIEFERNLSTGNSDDVEFDLSSGREYLFGVSIFSLYGRPHDPNSPNLYGRGRISEPLLLSFE
jgi:hypothetical protein